MIKKLYSWFHKMTSPAEERGEYSGGLWQDMVRKGALAACGSVKGRLLEVGCGEGIFLAAAAKASPDAEIYGIDNDMERIALAENRARSQGLNNVTVLLQDAPSINFNDSYFDAVVCINVFFNMPSIGMVEETLAQMKRVCKTGGKIIFDFRNAKNPLLAAKYKLAKYYDETVKDLPLNTCDPGCIREILEKLSLDVVIERPVGFRVKALAPIILIEARKR